MAVRFVSSEAAVLDNVQGGTVYPLRLRQVLASGTTATDWRRVRKGKATT